MTLGDFGFYEGFEVVNIYPLQRATSFVQAHAAEIRQHGWDNPQPELIKAVGRMGVYNR